MAYIAAHGREQGHDSRDKCVDGYIEPPSCFLHYPRPRFMIIDMSKLRIPDDVMEYFRKTGSIGGKARAKTLTPRQRSEIASAAAQARWKKSK